MTPDPAHREWLKEITESQAEADRRRTREAMRGVYVRRRIVALAVIALAAFFAGVLVGHLV